MGFTASENPGNSLQISCVKTWHQGQAPSILSLWVECLRFNKKLQTPTSPSGRKVWEVWDLLAKCAPSPAARRPASSWTCQHLPPGQAALRKSQHPRAPCCRHRGEQKGWKKQPLVVCWCCCPGCPVPPPLPWAALPACSFHPSLKTQHLNWQQAWQKCGGWRSAWLLVASQKHLGVLAAESTQLEEGGAHLSTLSLHQQNSNMTGKFQHVANEICCSLKSSYDPVSFTQQGTSDTVSCSDVALKSKSLPQNIFHPVWLWTPRICDCFTEKRGHSQYSMKDLPRYVPWWLARVGEPTFCSILLNFAISEVHFPDHSTI